MKRTGTTVYDNHVLTSRYKKYDIMLSVEGRPSDIRLQEIDDLLTELLDIEFGLYKIKYLTIRKKGGD